jgi:hypothetical protein
MTQKERMAIVVKSGVALATVIKWDRGQPLTDSRVELIEAAASELGLLEKREASKTGIEPPEHLREVSDV